MKVSLYLNIGSSISLLCMYRKEIPFVLIIGGKFPKNNTICSGSSNKSLFRR